MKKNYAIILSVFIAVAAQAQLPTVSLSSPTVCAGETVTATIVAPEFSLASSAVADNVQNGVMFDLVGVNGAIIKGFTVDIEQDNTSFEIYYRTGSYVGFEDSNAGWTLLGSSSGIAMGTGVNTGIELDVEILPGQTLGFYVTCTGSLTEYIEYADGTAVGTQLASNYYFAINSGVGKSYPFATTYSPRDFVGSVLFEPIISDISWTNNPSTSLTADYTVDRTQSIIATGTYEGIEGKATAIVTVNDYEVEATATPAILGWDESSTLEAATTLVTGLGTTFEAGNGQEGAMFDVSAVNGLDISGFSVYPSGTTNANVEIFYKTGTFVGSEFTSGDWISIATATGLVGEEVHYVPLTSPLSIAPGQTFGIYITRTDGSGFVSYTNGLGVGTVYNSDPNLIVKCGSGIAYPFAASFPDRMLNTIVHYEIENPAGLNYAWAPTGGTAATETVTPNADVTYTVTVDDGTCEGSDDVAVSMALGIEDALAESLVVYPNPATDNLTVSTNQPLNVQHIALLDLTGKAVYQMTPSGAFTTATIPVNQLATGMYLLQLNVDGKLTNRKVAVR